MKFYTQYDRPSLDECPLEVHEDEGKVERVGYMETDKLVNTFIMAGERLKMFRGAEFESEKDVPADYSPVNYGSEMDAILAMRDVNARLEAQRAEAMKKAEEEAKKKVEDAKAAEAV